MKAYKVIENGTEKIKLANNPLGGVNVYYASKLSNRIQVFNTTPQYIIVGSPTISNGTVSGFSADDYLKLSQTVSSGTAKTFEIFTKFTTPASFSADSSLICIQTYFSYGLRIMRNNSSSATLWATSHSNSTYYNINGTSGAILPSTTYYAQYIVDGENGTQTLRISTDKQNWSEFTGEYSTGYYNDSSILWLIGKSVYGASECSIDLNETYIIVNDKVFFRGNFPNWQE